MTSAPRVLVVIPARGGSKAIPRKNLRHLAGRPLLQYAVEVAKGCSHGPDVVVSSDDEEILGLAAGLGVQAIERDPALATDAATLDPVVHEACVKAEAANGCRYDIIVTLQPTSPLLEVASLDAALQRMIDRPELDTVISARSDAHLGWRVENGRYVPDYASRLNRQQLPPHYRETGAFLISRRALVTAAGRIGSNVDLHLLPPGQDIDIDTPDDWAVCESRLARRRVLFVVTGSPVLGLGHVHNALLVAGDLSSHEIAFLVDRDSALARDEIASRNYPVRLQSCEDIVQDVLDIAPDVVINDRLDTSADYTSRLKQSGITLINFEDLGAGAENADLVINAIYPDAELENPRHYFGPGYFVIRDEFLVTPVAALSQEVRRVLLSFGGVDPNNLTHKVLKAIHPECLARGIEITIVAGMGYSAYDSLMGFSGVEVVRSTRRISSYMARADVAFTSAGRTTFEIASLGVPCIVLAQNQRETTHLFATPENGFISLGLGAQVRPDEIALAFAQLADSKEQRTRMRELMLRTDLRGGRARVHRLVANVIAAHRRQE